MEETFHKELELSDKEERADSSPKEKKRVKNRRNKKKVSELSIVWTRPFSLD